MVSDYCNIHKEWILIINTSMLKSHNNQTTIKFYWNTCSWNTEKWLISKIKGFFCKINLKIIKWFFHHLTPASLQFYFKNCTNYSKMQSLLLTSAVEESTYDRQWYCIDTHRKCCCHKRLQCTSFLGCLLLSLSFVLSWARVHLWGQECSTSPIN